MSGAIVNFYPLFIVTAGFVAAALLSERALARMPPEAKVALVDASARTRLLNVLVIPVFVGLIIWRPVLAWAFVGLAYLGLAVRSVFRVQRLGLPAPISRLLQAANLSGCSGMIICACVYELRAVQ